MKNGQLLRYGGIAAFVAAIVVVINPLPSGVIDRFIGVASESFVLVFAVVLAVLGLRYGYGAVVRHADEPPFEQPPEEASAYDVSRSGSSIDSLYETLVEDEIDSPSRYQYKADRLRADLRAAAVEAVADAEGVSRDSARETVESGAWTDDIRARSFLAESVERPLEMRVRDWASGRGLKRQVDGTIAEIERIAAVPATHDPREASGSVEQSGSARKGGIEAGELSLTDRSSQVEATVTSVDTETDTDSHWNVGIVVAFVLSGAGFALSNATIVLAAIIPVSFAVYGSLTRPPDLNVDIERTVVDGSPVPGEPVRVGVTVTNIGERPLAELRVIDGVPDSLRVVAGSPRLCVSLEPGESATATYTVEAFRGTHTFESASLWARNISGEVERSCRADLQTTLRCRDDVEAMPTTRQTTPYQGRIETDVAGAGLEFYATREYQSNDPLNRIDWNYWAQTGDPRTVEFRQTRAGTIVVVVDDRRVSRKARDEVTPDAVELGRHAALRVANALLDDTNAVGGALLKLRRYESPGRGREQRHRLREFFSQSDHSTDDDQEESSSYSLEDVDGSFFSNSRFDWVASDRQPETSRRGGAGSVYVRDGGGIRTEWLRDRLPSRAQVVFVSPLLDDAPRRFLRTLQADGADVTVLSPNVTTTDSPGSTVARIERHERLRELRRRQIRVIDWAVDTPLSVAIDRAEHRWSR